jgi:hypothetical protein
MVRLLPLLLLLLACAPSGPAVRGGGPETPDVPEAGPLAGAGARCSATGCACRPIDEFGLGTGADAETVPPAEGLKRFELRTGRGDDEMRITVEGLGTFTKAAGSPEPGCIYVDLPPGSHRVRYHVIARDPQRGLEARLRISEYSTRFQRWYRTFAYRCGSGSEPCTKDDARDALIALSRVEKGKFDPCGSTKVKGLRFSTDRPPESLVSDFNLHLTLQVYKFVPRFPPESPTCKGVPEP